MAYFYHKIACSCYYLKDINLNFWCLGNTTVEDKGTNENLQGKERENRERKQR